MAERTGKQLAIYLPVALYERLDASARRNHRTKTTQVVLALEAFLAADEAAAGEAAAREAQRDAPAPQKGRRRGGGE